MDCASEQIIHDSAKKNGAFFSIYEDVDHTLPIRIVPHGVNIECQQEDVEISEQDAQPYYQPIVYLSNVFNPAELGDGFTTGDLGLNSWKQQHSYTPALIMKRHLDEKRKAYHSYYGSDYNSALYTLADLQMQDMTRAYADYQAVSFVTCYFHAPVDIRDELCIFNQITIKY